MLEPWNLAAYDDPYYTFQLFLMDLDIHLNEVWVRENIGNVRSFYTGT